MADPCIVRSGETVEVNDPRFNDTGCTIESGVIIRAPADLSVMGPIPPRPLPQPKAVAAAPPMKLVPPPIIIESPAAPALSVAERTSAVVNTRAIVVQPDPTEKQPDPPQDSVLTAAVAVGAVMVAGTAAAATSMMGGVSTLQAKVGSMFGASKATVATATVVTAGTIVAVKALESKMNKLESDLSRTKGDVGEASKSIDRIDELLSKLGN
jgi:hypothetical protein